MFSRKEAGVSPFDLTGRAALVTGGGRGIGRDISTALARAGADVAVIYRSGKQAADETAKAVRALGRRACAIEQDMGEVQTVAEAFGKAAAELGQVDILVNNAGIADLLPWRRVDPELMERTLRVNVMGPFFLAQAAAKHMVERGGGGKLVTISSITERFGAAKQPSYAASKAALGALVRSLAIELARHDIQVNNLQPGWIETDATEPMRDKELLSKTVVKRTPARRWGTPADFEGIAVYLASDASRFHTGDTICVDGGYSIF